MSSSKCPYCGSEYKMVRIPAIRGDGARLIKSTYCGCAAEANALREENRKRIQAELIDAWAKTGVPEAYKSVSPDYDNVEHILNRGWIYMYGPRGTGKTTAACAILKAYVRRTQKNGYASARFIDVPDLLASMRGNWSLEGDAYQRAAGVKVLILDDLGKGKASEWAMERIYRLINDRYKHFKPTIITSQYDIDHLAEKCSGNGDIETAEAMVSRIYQRSAMMGFTGPDRRMG